MFHMLSPLVQSSDDRLSLWMSLTGADRLIADHPHLGDLALLTYRTEVPGWNESRMMRDLIHL